VAGVVKKVRSVVKNLTGNMMLMKCKESYLFSKGKETEGMGKRLK